METQITNIVLEGNRFRVFATIEGNNEVNTFMPEVKAQDIKDWVFEREKYYQELKEKEALLQEELIGEL